MQEIILSQADKQCGFGTLRAYFTWVPGSLTEEQKNLFNALVPTLKIGKLMDSFSKQDLMDTDKIYIRVSCSAYNLFIPYKDSEPHNNMIVEVIQENEENTFYTIKGGKDKINDIINWSEEHLTKGALSPIPKAQ